MKVFFTYTFAFFLLLSVSASGQRREGIPFHIKAQFAGDIGLVSLGVGKDFLNEKLDADVFVGYLPESIGGDEIVTGAIKVAYVPFRPVSVGIFAWRPLRTGLQVSYTFGDNFFATQPEDKYPKEYYQFSTAIHYAYFLGGEIDFTGIRALERFGIYYEAAALGEYIVAYAVNPKYLNPAKIFNLGLGIRYSF